VIFTVAEIDVLPCEEQVAPVMPPDELLLEEELLVEELVEELDEDDDVDELVELELELEEPEFEYEQ
jgi:hypothetical protein